jgi:hypothetical protein
MRASRNSIPFSEALLPGEFGKKRWELGERLRGEAVDKKMNVAPFFPFRLLFV